MNKKELVNSLAEQNNTTKKMATELLDNVLNIMVDTLSKGENVELFGFGKFKINPRKAYTARNPKTGDPINVPAKKVVAFKPSKRLKDAVDAE